MVSGPSSVDAAFTGRPVKDADGIAIAILVDSRAAAETDVAGLAQRV
jgi:hypothetical protein